MSNDAKKRFDNTVVDTLGEPWIGVDLDGTLAYYDHWRGERHIGAPIPLMRDRVLMWLEEGKDVRIFTARLNPPNNIDNVVQAINEWCLEHLGQMLPITATKDQGMIELWDDRCIQVVANTGKPKMRESFSEFLERTRI